MFQALGPRPSLLHIPCRCCCVVVVLSYFCSPLKRPSPPHPQTTGARAQGGAGRVRTRTPHDPPPPPQPQLPCPGTGDSDSGGVARPGGGSWRPKGKCLHLPAETTCSGRRSLRGEARNPYARSGENAHAARSQSQETGGGRSRSSGTAAATARSVRGLTPGQGGRLVGCCRPCVPACRVRCALVIGARHRVFSLFLSCCRDIKPDNILLDEHGRPAGALRWWGWGGGVEARGGQGSL